MSRIRLLKSRHQSSPRLFVYTGCLIFLAIFATSAFNPSSLLVRWLHPRQGFHQHTCEVNLEIDFAGLEQYTSDYGRHFPQTGAAVTSSSGWAFGLQAYTKNFENLHCLGDAYDKQTPL